MKEIFKIREELAAKGWVWPPNYKDIETRIWPFIETYFDNDESLLSALWASFERFNSPMIGMIFITDKRIFTVEIDDDNIKNNIRYVPIDKFKIDKIEFKKAKSNEELNLINLQSDTYGGGIEFYTPNKKVAQHFLNTLSGISEIEIIEIEAEKSELKSSVKNEEVKAAPEKKQIINFENEIKPVLSPQNLEQKSEIVTEENIVAKTSKPKKIKGLDVPKNEKTKYLFFLIPIFILIVILVLVFSF
ncbi:hypothetical protein [Spiroplasma alleghenense]|uniref:Uncharacterized protein n=1 Tax=Spiroplasma alleghenense TaxID=216931 RepID=A0A345Z3B5_9MOLU|nr:hypothetical protein [Spiroplasma alleghenense]AXK51094.1 hypothetical protein SALLE_v1c04200 [Spiroplasma alleghenense]